MVKRREQNGCDPVGSRTLLTELQQLYFSFDADENKDYRMVTIPVFFSKSSCVYNPLIYAFINKQVSRLPSNQKLRSDKSTRSASRTAAQTPVIIGKHFHLYENISKVDPFEGPQYYLAPSWAFNLQAAFMGFVFCAGTPLNLVVLLAVAKYKKLRVPLNYILVNISFAGFIFVTFSVSQVFFASLKGYYFFGHTLCALESAVGSIAGLVTAWSLAVLSFARYLVICKPFGAFKFDTNHAMGAVLFTWVIGVFCATPPFWGWSR
ncbi:putative violet-sensitive opsin [Amphiprion ocellaris]|uniref:putative violet-sensitive opsin n=1 Tax=Amphiprion ocellaris TaxID=80972 RepID=UPI00241130EA|nr:putative violet-sensitive opsin [Amphiprion ocellaris]